MRLWLALRVIPILAILGLAITPVFPPARATAVAGVASAATTEDMPCCPHEKPVIPDCSKTCPLFAVCSAKCAQNVPAASIVLKPAVIIDRLMPADDMGLGSFSRAPPPRPPRT